ncbi:hypothetical protein HDK77DRAFT_37178 [Phyllosticta capitalensis]
MAWLDLRRTASSEQSAWSKSPMPLEQPPNFCNSQRPNQSTSQRHQANDTTSPPLPSGTSTSIVELLAGQTGKSFKVHRDLLINRSPYFRSLLANPSSSTPSPKASFPDLDEFAFALFVRWLYGAALHGPSDYASMQHYLCLYVLARRFRIERLQNDVLDLVRAYYRAGNMTAPAHRLEYLYDATATDAAASSTSTAESAQSGVGANNHSNMMRRFLVQTAAYRYLCEREPRLSDAMRGVISRGGDLAVDFAEAMAALHQNQVGDVRKGPDCAFHEHKDTPACKARLSEAYE